MKYLIVLILLIQMISCNVKSEKIDKLKTETNTNVSRKNTSNVSTPIIETNETQKKTIHPTPPVPPKIKIPKIPKIINEPINCFDPNLKINEAIDLINTGIEDTQWFTVERKKVNYKHRKLDQTDTIWIKKELQKFGWQLVDSVQTNIGNQNKIALKMIKGNRICNIEKKLYLSNTKTDNAVEESFEITEMK